MTQEAWQHKFIKIVVNKCCVIKIVCYNGSTKYGNGVKKMKKVTIKTIASPKYSNAVGSKKYRACKVYGGYQVISKRFGLFIDDRDVMK